MRCTLGIWERCGRVARLPMPRREPDEPDDVQIGSTTRTKIVLSSQARSGTDKRQKELESRIR